MSRRDMEGMGIDGESPYKRRRLDMTEDQESLVSSASPSTLQHAHPLFSEIYAPGGVVTIGKVAAQETPILSQFSCADSGLL